MLQVGAVRAPHVAGGCSEGTACCRWVQCPTTPLLNHSKKELVPKQ